MLPYLLSGGGPTRRIVVSLTTRPERLMHLRPVLESILKGQTVPPNAVYLILPLQDYYTKDELQYGQPWPDYINELLESSPLEILQPEFAYGPLTSILYALGKEVDPMGDTISTIGPASATTSITVGKATTIISVNDSVVYGKNLIELLADGSRDHPESVVALSGAKLRSDFRQVRFYGPAELDKFPNLYVTTGNTGDAVDVDIVQGLMGLALSSTTVNRHQLLSLVQDETLPQTVLELDGIFLSAMMEELNVTRVVVKGGSGLVTFVSNSTDLPDETMTVPPGNQIQWMEATHHLQQKWNIWKDYHLLNPSLFTPSQIDGILCEAAHTPDCTSHATICLPSSDCPEAEYVLSELVMAPEKEPSDPI